MTFVIRIVSALFVAGVLVTGVLWLDAHLRGWRRIARRFRTAAPPAGVTPIRQQGDVGGGVGLFNLHLFLRAAVCDDGLFMAAPSFFRHSHPPILVPWSHISLREDQTRLGSRTVRLSIGRVHLGFITLRGGIAGEVRERVLDPIS
ncbi:MAG: hypothetical protein L0271_18435 [Gemmatimonadetes bacterium]|nr:hypothetical protein [Gemmatimonadota bacterium]